MTTPVLGAAIVNKLIARAQAVRWTATLKEVRQFRAYCCNINSAGIMGVAKEPVIVANITPNPACLGQYWITDNISWDLTESYAPGSTITSWDIDFGDGSSDTGGAIGTASGTHAYQDVGTYTITIVIAEGGGRSQTSQVEVVIVDCSGPPLNWTYISTLGSGVYFIDWTDNTPTWTARNTGLAGDALYVNSMVMKPGDERKPDAVHELWIATRGGVFKTENGGRGWQQMDMPDPSNDEFLDVPAAVVGDLEWTTVRFDPKQAGVVYVEASKVA